MSPLQEQLQAQEEADALQCAPAALAGPDAPLLGCSHVGDFSTSNGCRGECLATMLSASSATFGEAFEREFEQKHKAPWRDSARLRRPLASPGMGRHAGEGKR